MPRSSIGPSAAERAEMHDLDRRGGAARRMAPHVVYTEAACPHPGCSCAMQAIDFRLGDHDRAVHDTLVPSWWDDTGFAGRCPECGGWVHFTILGKRAIGDDEASRLPTLPDDWHAVATVL